MGQKANTLTLRKNNNKLESYASNSKTFLNANHYIDTLKRGLEKKNVIIVSHSFDATTDTFDLSLNLFFKTRKIQRYLKKKFKVKLPPYVISNRKWFFWRAIRREAWIKRRKKKENLISFPIKKKKISGLIHKLRKRRRLKKWILIHKRKKKTFFKKKASQKIGWAKTLSTLTKNLPSNNLIVHKITLLNKQINMKIIDVIQGSFKRFKKILFSRRFDLYYDFLKLTSLLLI